MSETKRCVNEIDQMLQETTGYCMSKIQFDRIVFIIENMILKHKEDKVEPKLKMTPTPTVDYYRDGNNNLQRGMNQDFYNLIQLMEELGASEKHTKAVTMAGELQNKVYTKLYDLEKIMYLYCKHTKECQLLTGALGARCTCGLAQIYVDNLPTAFK